MFMNYGFFKVKVHSLFTDFDIALFKTGKHYHIYNLLGSHLCNLDGENGCYFAVYAPNAEKICVVGEFNHWNGAQHMLYSRWDGSGIWEGLCTGGTRNYLQIQNIPIQSRKDKDESRPLRHQS